MVWDESRFDRFVQATRRMVEGDLPGYGYPHVILPYAPTDELSCIASLRDMPARLTGLTTTVVPVAEVVAEVTRRYADDALPDALACKRLEEDLGNPQHGIARSVARRIAKRLSAQTRVVVLGRLGALHPFCSVSTLLDAVYAEGVHHTIAAAYPGSAEGVSLRFLDLHEPHGGYRGHIVT